MAAVLKEYVVRFEVRRGMNCVGDTACRVVVEAETAALAREAALKAEGITGWGGIAFLSTRLVRRRSVED